MNDKEFKDKYKKEIEGISNYNKVDLSVATEMFKTNLRQENGVYGGGGKAENWSEMISDYKKLQESIWTTSKDKKSSGKGDAILDSLNVGNGSFDINNDTVGVIVGVGVLYMFLTIFRR